MRRHMEDAQRAVAILAARANGDHGDAAALLAEFEGHESMALAFFSVAELSLQLHAAEVRRPPAVLASQLALDLAHAASRADAR